MTDNLWPYQSEAIELACKTLAAGGRATEVMACGTGKSRIGARAAAALARQSRRLVIAPTVTLLAQLLQEYRAAIGGGTVGRVVAVCREKISGAGQAESETISP
jgi:predicted helicase